jgi:Ca2+-binding RTX toxin-like protein
MANDGGDSVLANLIGFWDFRTGAEADDTGLDDGIAQDGVFQNGAVSDGEALCLDGDDDRFDVSGEDGPFDLAQGSIVVEFNQAGNDNGTFQTVVNRGEFWDAGREGYFEIHVDQDGSVVVTHTSGTASITESTGPGIMVPGDDVRATYTWSDTDGGQFLVENLTTGASSSTDITQTGLTMDIGGNDNENFTFGARENTDDEFLKFFEGKIDYVAVYDGDITLPPTPPPTGSDGIVTGTGADDVIDLTFVDEDGDRIDNNDSIFTPVGSNDDIVNAGGGDDTIESGEGSDIVNGGEGDDVINTDDGGLPLLDRGFPSYEGLPAAPVDPDPEDDRDEVNGGAGNDFISTGDDRDTISGGSGDDTIYGGIDADLITGGSGSDRIIGGEGADTIGGSDGDDVIYGGLGGGLDALNIRDDGQLRAADPDTGNGTDILDGGAGNDLIYGQDDNDTITGGAGNDTIDGGIDQDDMSGGADRDLFVNVNQGDAVDGGEGGDDFDTLDLRGSGDASNPGGTFQVELDAGNPENGTVTYFDDAGIETGTLDFLNIEEVIPCFTPGTLIATPKGERRVEDLKVGDRVITRDNGIQEIRWLGARGLTGTELSHAEHLRPVLIRQGALGGGLPERDMMVSPNHRVLVANDKTALYFEEREVLAAAKHLTGLDGVDVVEVSDVTYIHFMFDQHEVVLSDGAWTESFQPGDMTLAGIGNAQRNEIFELFPELKTSEGIEAYQAARRSLKKHEAYLLTH